MLRSESIAYFKPEGSEENERENSEEACMHRRYCAGRSCISLVIGNDDWEVNIFVHQV